MTKFSEVKEGDWVQIENDMTGMVISGTVTTTMHGTIISGRFAPTTYGTTTAILFEGQPSTAYTGLNYKITEHRPTHSFPEVGKPIEMWNGTSEIMAKLSKSIGFWDGKRYCGIRFDESVGRTVEVCWDSDLCSDKIMKAIEWRYLG